YRFTGPNLSGNSDIDLRIEDGYWNRSDAAVVFRRTDHRTGDVRYIYHGNDGTHMPWNDTAQLNFLKAEVREAVFQTIAHVARKFSIIRFDAAMVLTKKHFQRLWFPQPGTGGAIPSRSDYAMSAEEFNRAIPSEFWRDVVDRINAEIPNTLLLAEAFWLLEGYFVRSLGMHRVYNSAFMHMLMKEENSKYRALIKNTMHYNPEILKRYVNFMSNPDEETAIAQFGKDDKYFGVCLLMVTLPGLPMFGHGQIEGFTEKYGMEYKRAYYNEQPDQHLIWRHEQEIFPLMKQRHLFSQVTHFELYDFIDAHGNLNENILAYSNRSGDERAIICYHNTYAETAGWIKMSIGRNIGSTDEPTISRRSLAEALGIREDENYFYIFRDRKSTMEFLRSGREFHEQGLYIELKAFQYQIFKDFREIHDTTGTYRGLAHHVQGRGVPDMQQALKEYQLAPVHTALGELLSKQVVGDIVQVCFPKAKATKSREQKIHQVVQKVQHLLTLAAMLSPTEADTSVVAAEFKTDLIELAEFFSHESLWKFDKGRNSSKISHVSGWGIESRNRSDHRNILILISWLVVRRLSRLASTDVFEQLDLARAFERIFQNAGRSRDELNDDLALLRIRLKHQTIFMDFTRRDDYRPFAELLEQPDVLDRIKVNVYNNVTYYNKESFEELMWWLFIVESFDQMRMGTAGTNKTSAGYNRLCHILKVSDQCAYKFEALKRIFATTTGEAILKV
ncbi:MAG: alpha-amylase, partial [Ignavibacteriales bacterium]|nr:alpha-amylase [Ignavibacteriales bacterium]